MRLKNAFGLLLYVRIVEEWTGDANRSWGKHGREGQGKSHENTQFSNPNLCPVVKEFSS